VSLIIRVQLSVAETSAEFVHDKIEPPSLVIRDGTTTVVFSPAGVAGGMADAAEFAETLVQVASEWESGCRRTIAGALSEDPFTVDALVAEYGHRPSLGDGDRA
jgi:hypothetical protein